MQYLISLLVLSFSICCASIPSSLPFYRLPVIVFDFGSVVGGSDPVLEARAVAPVLGLSFHDALLLMCQLKSSKQKEISPERFWQEYELSSGKRLPDDWKEQFEKISLLSIRANPQMLDLVDELRHRGYQVALLSNVRASRAAFIREQGIYSHFDPVVLSCEIGVKKPQKEAFYALLHQAHVSASDCIMIDDKLENIKAAEDVGMDAILFTSVEELKEKLEERGITLRPWLFLPNFPEAEREIGRDRQSPYFAFARK